ncbi:MAG: DUF4250 domain-containing protein [Bacteroides sp.]|nr:DUF4250 domain-containing protein [Bacteroides sp.]MCM1550787.1 DUF4250 domain-containing protein [Clostridium sp.]
MALEQLPGDPLLLLSVVNTKLRDFYTDLDSMCEDLGVDAAWVEEKLKTVGYAYDKEQNQFR